MALSATLERFARSTRVAIDGAAELGEADTADVFTEVSRGMDKLLWKVEVHEGLTRSLERDEDAEMRRGVRGLYTKVTRNHAR